MILNGVPLGEQESVARAGSAHDRADPVLVTYLQAARDGSSSVALASRLVARIPPPAGRLCSGHDEFNRRLSLSETRDCGNDLTRVARWGPNV